MANTKNGAETCKMTETLANGYSSESTQQELSNEYQHDRVQMFFKNLCIPVLWMKVASALEGLILTVDKNSLPILMILCRQKLSQETILMEKCLSEHNLQLSFNYFVNPCIHNFHSSLGLKGLSWLLLISVREEEAAVAGFYC